MKDNNSKWEIGWTWVTRLLAVAGFISILLSQGLTHMPWGVSVLLIGLFFGPDILKKQFNINRGEK